MCKSSRPSLMSLAVRLAVGGLLCSASASYAQMVPRGEHFLQQSQTSGVTAVRLRWGGEAAEQRGAGLALKSSSRWLKWEGRMGAVMDRPLNPLRDSFVLAQPAQAGLRMRSLHLLSDYYLEGGFRATVGIVSGETGQAWWSSGERGGGLNVSVQHIDNLANPLLVGGQRGLSLHQPNTYVGAGYSSRLGGNAASDSWRFNADVGLLNATSTRLSDGLQAERSLDEALRSAHMRPVVKVSVGYAF
jgi:hypothetical protein